ncbi:MAG: hypothetical protein LBL81_05900 [Tannerella sp.]|nr:hypothetical protein [Tannerella sp.]
MKIVEISFLLLLSFSVKVYSQTEIVAHRGYWNCPGSAPNSLASLEKADSLGCFASEFDVNISRDSTVFVYHNSKIGRLDMDEMSDGEIGSYRLPDGEPIPTLEAYLQKGALLDVHLFLEIKVQSNPGLQEALIRRTLDLVRRHDLQERTIFISLSRKICDELIRIDPSLKVGYVGGDAILTPRELANSGYYLMDYYYEIYQRNPSLISEAHKAGIKAGVWVVGSQKDVLSYVQNGIDYITTDNLPGALTYLKAQQAGCADKPQPLRINGKVALYGISPAYPVLIYNSAGRLVSRTLDRGQLRLPSVHGVYFLINGEKRFKFTL